MTGGGNTQVGYLHEPAGNYMGAPTDNDYKTPGRDASLTEISFSNAVQRLYGFAQTEAVDSVATIFEGAISVDFALANPWWHNHLFGGAPTDGGEGSAPYSYTWSMGTGQVQSSRWFAGVDYFGGTAERELKGVVFGGLTVTCNVGEVPRVQLTGFYGDETKNTSLTPGNQPQEQADPLVFHGGTLEIPTSTSFAKIQSATLNVATGARPQRGWQRAPVDAVMGAVETSLDVSKIVTGTNELELAYGGSTEPASGDVAEAATGKLEFASSGDTLMRYDLSDITPDEYDWPDFGNPETDVTEDITFAVEGIEAYAESSQSSAR